MVNLYPHQWDAVGRMHNGCILVGDVGSGKSRTSLAYYFMREGLGDLKKDLPMQYPKDLYIITTARKRDMLEWEKECLPFGLGSYPIQVVIDSWNNIKKYVGVKNAFFIFDEQRVVGSGTWAKSFIRIARGNRWILLSATPGDTWMDYIPVFVANGYFRNRTDFINQHVIYARFSKFPKVDRFVAVRRLQKLRDSILVNMDYKKKTGSVLMDIQPGYDRARYLDVNRNRWNPYTGEPIQNASELCYTLRKVVHSDASRLAKMTELLMKHRKAIVFYNFDYELELLRGWAANVGICCAEYNGHKHEPVPEEDSWVYLVQYTAGAEGWNCITTDTEIFFSLNYSYKTMKQAAGRIDRLNTPYQTLYYYRFISSSPIDLAVKRALSAKKNFNESAFVGKL